MPAVVLAPPCCICLILDCLGPHVGAQLICTCLPWTIKGKTHAIQGISEREIGLTFSYN
jgi:hypothetical protein